MQYSCQACELPNTPCTCRLEGSRYAPTLLQVHNNASMLLVSTRAHSESLL
jgi:hypothetical protein